MKKSSLILMISLVLSSLFNCYSQSIYTDAMKLNELGNPTLIDGKVVFQLLDGKKESLISILSKYFPSVNEEIVQLLDAKSSLSREVDNYDGRIQEIDQKIADEIDLLNNPFLKLARQTESQTILGFLNQGSKQISKLGGLPVTTFADGLARFMVKRMKEELSVMFFDQFQRELENQKDLQILFPSTYAILQTAKKEIYNYQKFLPALRESFVYDMEEVLENSYKWSISDKTDKPILTELFKNRIAHNSIKVLLFSGNELDNGNHPGDVISKLKDEEKINFEEILPDLLSYLKIVDLFSQSLRSSLSDRYWITKEEVSNFQDEIFLKIYLGLIYQTEFVKKAEDRIRFKSQKYFIEFLENNNTNLNDIRKFIVPLAQEIAITQNRVDNIIQNEAKVKTSDYFNLFGNVLNVIQLTVNATFIKEPKPGSDFDLFKFYSGQTSFLYANIQSKAYPAAIYNSYAILSKAMENNNNTGEVNKGLEQFLKYGTFMATVATSESSEEVADAIEAVALPPGSARIKREAAWNLSLNSYLGAFYGVERLTLSPKDKSGVMGVFAPVGLAFSRNFSMAKNGRWNFSGSLFTSIIDIGALASFRLNNENDEVSTLPEIKLENIVSPGLYGVIGLPRIPISVGGGYQVGPVLREVSADKLTLGSKSNRWSVFIAVDIPLLNFWTKSRKVPPVKKGAN